MVRFSDISIHQSNAALTEDHMNIFKFMNIQLKVIFEGSQENLLDPMPTNEETADQLANIVRAGFLKMETPWPSEDAKKVKLTLVDKAQEAADGEFGFFKMT